MMKDNPAHLSINPPRDLKREKRDYERIYTTYIGSALIINIIQILGMKIFKKI